MATDDDQADLIKKAREIVKMGERFEERKRRARDRAKDTKPGWYFAIIGQKPPIQPFAFTNGTASFRNVEEPPGEVELAGALRDKRLLSSAGRYLLIVQTELFVAEEGRTGLNIGWWILSLVRIKSLTDFLVPMAASHSWSTIAGLEPSTCDISLVEDYPNARRLEGEKEVTAEHLKWVDANLTTFADLLEVKTFRLAVEALTTHHFQASERMMVAILWAALDALFTIQSELTFRLSLCVATVLEPPGSERAKVFARMKELYRMRSKAVHGQAIKDDELHSHTVEVRTILSRILCKFVENKKVRTAKDVESEWLGSPSI